MRDLLLDAVDGVAALRWQDDEQLHLKLRFIGEVERPVAEDLALALGRVRFALCSIRIAGVGRFDHHRRGTLWAGVEPRAPLAALAAKVERVCVGADLAPERRAFHPHITLARWGRGVDSSLDPWLAAHAALRREEFLADRVTLYQSLGRNSAHYEEVVSYALT